MGEPSGSVDGQMDEGGVEDDVPADWAVEDEGTKDGGGIEEEHAEDGLTEGGEDEAKAPG